MLSISITLSLITLLSDVTRLLLFATAKFQALGCVSLGLTLSKFRPAELNELIFVSSLGFCSTVSAIHFALCFLIGCIQNGKCFKISVRNSSRLLFVVLCQSSLLTLVILYRPIYAIGFHVPHYFGDPSRDFQRADATCCLQTRCSYGL